MFQSKRRYDLIPNLVETAKAISNMSEARSKPVILARNAGCGQHPPRTADANRATLLHERDLLGGKAHCPVS